MSNWVGSRVLIFSTACINGVIPCLSSKSISCPLAIKYATISVWPNILARWIDEKPIQKKNCFKKIIFHD
jgi:hypothetical protein